VIHIREIRLRIVGIEQCRSKAKRGTVDHVLDESHRQGNNLEIGVVFSEFSSSIVGRIDGHDRVRGFRSKEILNDLVPAVLETKNSMDTPFLMLAEHQIGEVTSIIDYDIALLQNFEMLPSRDALVLVRGEIEIEGDFGLELVKTTGPDLLARRRSYQNPWESAQRSRESEAALGYL
jgi:hypothetical protein